MRNYVKTRYGAEKEYHCYVCSKYIGEKLILSNYHDVKTISNYLMLLKSSIMNEYSFEKKNLNSLISLERPK